MYQFLALILGFVIGVSGYAAEESFSFDEVDETSAKSIEKPKNHAMSKMHFFGRASVRADFTSYDSADSTHKVGLQSDHFFLFLRTNVTDNISFQAEIVNGEFYYLTQKIDKKLKVKLGKILVPFGDESRYHRAYGGLSNLFGNAILVPNIWAVLGAHAEMSFGSRKLDVFLTEGFDVVNKVVEGDEPVNISNDANQQLIGFRYSFPIKKLNLKLSYLFQEWRSGSPLHGYGLDANIDFPHLSKYYNGVELRAGVAQFDIQKTDTDPFKRTGDFFESSFRFVKQNKIRIRYGTYDDDSRAEDQKDRKSWSLAWQKRIGPTTFLVENQWNLESVSEVDNDLLRLMATVEF